MESKIEKYLVRRVCEMIRLGWTDFEIVRQLHAVHLNEKAGDAQVRKYIAIARQL
jgi:hypothetical protein